MTRTMNITMEISFVERVRHVFTTCGRKAAVEQKAASSPIHVSQGRLAIPFVVIEYF